ncbi:hypothetical protein [Adhaeretor mobilis]|uniref:hypothetical protein n=1 Tax=Adhaeretor mobilis TaxID=1930276 RepID=UPI00119F6869|nr:hypothetical protein [Adhaeretor mobilis]
MPKIVMEVPTKQDKKVLWHALRGGSVGKRYRTRRLAHAVPASLGFLLVKHLYERHRSDAS